VKGEQLKYNIFDCNRVYVVTFFQVDPLWVVDLSDPTQPAIRGELKVPGWSTYIQPYGDRLVAIGIDNTNGWRVAVSLFDVRDPAVPALLGKVPLGENSSWSEANWDEKAFGFLPDSGLILVPFSTYSTNQQEGVQLIDFNQNSLAKRGSIPHAMQARRSTVYKDRILSISGRELLSVDAANRDKPVVRAEVPLAWGVDRVFVQGDYLIELETGSSWAVTPQPTLRVVPKGKSEQIVNALPLLNLPVVGAGLRDNHLYLLQGNQAAYGPIFFAGDAAATGDPTNGTRLVCSVVDLTRLPQIQVLSSTELLTTAEFGGSAVPLWPKADLLVWARQQASYWPWRMMPVDLAVGGVAIMPSRGGFWYPFSSSSGSQLLAVDVVDPLALKFVSEVTLTSTNGWASFSKPAVADSSVFLSRQLTETSITGTNYFVSTNITYTVATNITVVTNYIKVPQYTVQTNDTLVTNVMTLAVKNVLPEPLLLSSSPSATVIAGGAAHSAALTGDGTVWTWGSNQHGQLGNPSASDHSDPAPVPLLSAIRSVASGAFHTLALKADGTVWAWGDDGFGQLGDGSSVTAPNLPPLPEIETPFPVQALGLKAVVSIAAGNWHSLAVQADGTVFGWGANWAGQLGDGTLAGRSTPGPVRPLADVVQVAGGLAHSLALRRDGSVWAWGANGSGQLGDGGRTDRSVPMPIIGLNDVVALAAGHSHSLALKKDGTLWAWGLNESGQLGDGTSEDRLKPERITSLDQVVSIVCGQSHSLALRSDGTIWAWGRNKDGQRADLNRTDALRPTLAAQLPQVGALATGASHALAISADGAALYAWGNNDYGQLGNGLPLTSTNVSSETNNITITTWTETAEVVFRTNLIKMPLSITVTNEQPIYTSRQLSYLDVVDFTAPANPVVRAPITIPGALQGVSHQGAVVYLLGPGLNKAADDGREWLHACAYDGVACYLVDSHPLPEQWPHPLLVNAPDIFVARPEVEKVAARGLEVWRLSDAGKFTKINDEALASNASTLQTVGDLLITQEDTGLEVFSLQQAGQLLRAGLGAPSGCLGWSIESAAGSSADGLWLPLGLYGVEHISLKP
jgi:alpha-tubulin suppressor-like RCC1 family protein